MMALDEKKDLSDRNRQKRIPRVEPVDQWSNCDKLA